MKLRITADRFALSIACHFCPVCPRPWVDEHGNLRSPAANNGIEWQTSFVGVHGSYGHGHGIDQAATDAIADQSGEENVWEALDAIEAAVCQLRARLAIKLAEPLPDATVQATEGGQ